MRAIKQPVGPSCKLFVNILMSILTALLLDALGIVMLLVALEIISRFNK